MVVTGLIASIVGVCACVLLLPVISDLVSVGKVAFRPLRPAREDGEAARVIVLVPAHDEEGLIESCVRSLLATSYPDAKRDVTVIADNCSDRTAALARTAGARVLEREDTTRRGKPYAIEWALERIDLDAYDAVVIIDADTVVDAGFLEQLLGHDHIRRIAVQANYGVLNATDTDITWLSWIFGEARYHFSFLLKDRAGLNVPLQGNGMCIGTTVLREHGWQAFSICEDWELYAQYTTWGVRIHVAPDARLFAQEANTLAQSRSQRERWTAGKIAVLKDYGFRLLATRRAGVHQKVDALGELAMPGPVVHVGLVILLQLAILPLPAGVLAALSAALWLGVARQVLYAWLAARRSGELMRAVRALRGVPAYMIWRMWIQVRALRLVRSTAWVKTERNE